MKAWNDICGRRPDNSMIIGDVDGAPFEIGDVLGEGDLLDLAGACCGNW